MAKMVSRSAITTDARARQRKAWVRMAALRLSEQHHVPSGDPMVQFEQAFRAVESAAAIWDAVERKYRTGPDDDPGGDDGS